MRVLAAALVAALTIAAGGGSAAPEAAHAGIYTGYGFEACTAPSVSALKAWSVSPYRSVGIYLGGVNRACADGNLSASWVSTTLSLGWSLLPLYVGLQAPCVAQTKLQRISTIAATAANQGRAAADDAVAKAGGFGLPAGSPIYFDLEGYAANNAACTASVQSFVSAWHNELHALGHVSGVYGSAASTIRDIAALGATKPDNAWIANWNGIEDVFGDPYVSDSLWPNHQRVHQYKGGHMETYAGVTINIDSDYVDGAVVGGSAAPPPPPPPVEPPAGSVGSGDGKATATWPASSFTSSSVVTLTPTTQPPAPNGYGVQLTATDSRTSTPVARFGAPVIVHLLMTTDGLAPSRSTDGTTWKPLRHLTAALPADVDAGYTIDPDGAVEIQTLAPGFFGLLPDSVPPTQPPSFTGRFSHGALVLSWAAATDNSGAIGRYQLLLDGTPVSSLAAKTRRVTVRAFHATAQTVYRVRAVDGAGILGKPSPPLVVVPTKRPTDTPHALPRWAWGVLAYQHGGRARPKAAPHKLPGWYWHWAAWRLAPFHVKRAG